MPSLVGTEVARTRSRLATAARLGSPAERDAARRDHAAAKLAAHIAAIVAEAPPLTDEQKSRLTVLLGGGRDA